MKTYSKQSTQAQQLAELQLRVQKLENSRALERTSVLEEQMRTMLTRLQAMEKGGQLLLALERQQQLLQQDLQQLLALGLQVVEQADHFERLERQAVRLVDDQHGPSTGRC